MCVCAIVRYTVYKYKFGKYLQEHRQQRDSNKLPYVHRRTHKPSDMHETRAYIDYAAGIFSVDAALFYLSPFSRDLCIYKRINYVLYESRKTIFIYNVRRSKFILFPSIFIATQCWEFRAQSNWQNTFRSKRRTFARPLPHYIELDCGWCVVPQKYFVKWDRVRSRSNAIIPYMAQMAAFLILFF